MGLPVDITIYTRENCHLCAEATQTIERVSDETGVAVEITEIDVDTDETLRAEYGERVPYIFVDGWPAFKYRVDESKLRTQLTATH